MVDVQQTKLEVKPSEIVSEMIDELYFQTSPDNQVTTSRFSLLAKPQHNGQILSYRAKVTTLEEPYLQTRHVLNVSCKTFCWKGFT